MRHRARRVKPVHRDTAVAVACFALLLICGMRDDEPGDIGVLGVLATIVATAPLAVRTLYPIATLAAVIAGSFAVLVIYKPYESIITPGVLALYTVAVSGDRRRTVLVALAMLPVVPLAFLATGSHMDIAKYAQHWAFMMLALAVGAGVRDRRAWTAAMTERAERAERDREEEAVRRVSEERIRIAREIHDVVAHAMVAINVQAGVAAHLLDRRPEQAGKALTEIKRVSGDALADLRATLDLLRDPDAPAPTKPTDPLEVLEELAAPVRAAGLEVAVSIVPDPLESPIPTPIKAAGYRIVQESLTNVLRHAAASRVDVAVRLLDGGRAIELQVTDDGIGAAVNGNGAGGHGLRGMHERVQAVGGTLSAGPRDDALGWRVCAELPLVAEPIAAVR